MRCRLTWPRIVVEGKGADRPLAPASILLQTASRRSPVVGGHIGGRPPN